jgi:hypothetical protein
MENLDLEESLGISDTVSDRKFGNISKKGFITRYGDVSSNSEDTLRSGLKLQDDEQI